MAITWAASPSAVLSRPRLCPGSSELPSGNSPCLCPVFRTAGRAREGAVHAVGGSKPWAHRPGGKAGPRGCLPQAGPVFCSLLTLETGLPLAAQTSSVLLFPSLHMHVHVCMCVRMHGVCARVYICRSQRVTPSTALRQGLSLVPSSAISTRWMKCPAE